jgi:transcriptional regulator with XRE-family HTH domain
MPKPTQTLFGRRLREARSRSGIAQDKLGVMIGLDEGCSSARMSRYETGAHEPTFRDVDKIAQALGIPSAYFFCNDDLLAELVLNFEKLSADQRLAVRNYVQGVLAGGPPQI